MTEAAENPQQATAVRRIVEEYGRLLAVSVLALIVTIAILAIAEIAARQQFLALLAARIEAAQGEIVDLTRNDNAQQPELLDEYLSTLRHDLRGLQHIKSETEASIAVGARHDGLTLAILRGAERDGVVEENQPSVSYSVVSRSLRVVGLDVELLSVDHLLALSIITCGAIGALIGSIRSERRLTFKYLSLGFSSGFVTFLAIKGGKHIFLISSGADSAFFNPYSSAFAGLLAGLFTERAYQLLSTVVDQLAKRLEQAMK